MQLPSEWNLTWCITPVCYWYVCMDFLVFKSQMCINLSSQETRLVAVGENSQYRTQLLCCFKVYCNLRSTVDQIFTNLSSPHEESNSPSQEKPIARILALWALIKVTSFAFVSKLTSQNLRDLSLEAETTNEPMGLNLRLWIWFWIYSFSTLWPKSLFGETCRVRSQSRITLSIPAEATYLQVGCRSRDIMDYLCPLRLRMRQGSSSLFISYFKLFTRICKSHF